MFLIYEEKQCCNKYPYLCDLMHGSFFFFFNSRNIRIAGSQNMHAKFMLLCPLNLISSYLQLYISYLLFDDNLYLMFFARYPHKLLHLTPAPTSTELFDKDPRHPNYRPSGQFCVSQVLSTSSIVDLSY